MSCRCCPCPLPASRRPTPPGRSGPTARPQPVRFAPLAKKAAVRLWHRARDFDRSTRQPGRHGGALGHTGLQVLHALVFDFLNFATGRLDPSYAAIARKANVCERTVATALARLRELGILHWVRRCAESWRDGRFVLEQETNAYAVLPESQWRGYRPPAEAASARAGHVGRAAADAGCAGCRRRLRASTGPVCGRWCMRWRPSRRTAWRRRWPASGGRSWPETADFTGLQQMRRNLTQR